MPSKQEWQHVLVELFELIDMEELIEEMEIANWDVIAGWDESAVGGGINIIVIFEYHCFTVIERLNRWTLRLPLLFQFERLPQACLLLRLACWVILCSYSHLKIFDDISSTSPHQSSPPKHFCLLATHLWVQTTSPSPSIVVVRDPLIYVGRCVISASITIAFP